MFILTDIRMELFIFIFILSLLAVTDGMKYNNSIIAQVLTCYRLSMREMLSVDCCILPYILSETCKISCSDGSRWFRYFISFLLPGMLHFIFTIQRMHKSLWKTEVTVVTRHSNQTFDSSVNLCEV